MLLGKSAEFADPPPPPGKLSRVSPWFSISFSLHHKISLYYSLFSLSQCLTVIITSSELPEVESIAGAPSVLPTPFAAMHGLPSPLAGPYNGVPPAGGLAGLGGFPLGAAGLGVRVQGSAQASAVLLVSNLNEEVSNRKFRLSSPFPFFPPPKRVAPSTLRTRESPHEDSQRGIHEEKKKKMDGAPST